MTEEDLKISELGAYTNNSMNKEGLKKLVAKVNSGGGTSDAYTKAETDALLDDKQDVLTAGTNITIENNVISATGGGSSESWRICESKTDANNYFDSGKNTKDMMFVFTFKDVDNNTRKRYLFFPKGTVFVESSAISVNFISESSSKSIANAWKRGNCSISITMSANGIVDTSHWMVTEVEQTSLNAGVITNTFARTENYYYYNKNGVAFYVEVRE